MLRSDGIVGRSMTYTSVHDKEKEKSGLRHVPSSEKYVVLAFRFVLYSFKKRLYILKKSLNLIT